MYLDMLLMRYVYTKKWIVHQNSPPHIVYGELLQRECDWSRIGRILMLVRNVVAGVR